MTLPLGNPEGANTAVITWDHQGHNNWWWAIDNIKVTANDTLALAWELQDVVFDAKSTDTRIQFESLSDLDEAVMLDSVRLDEVTPANLYAVFSELENLAKASMKFGEAPYAKEEEQVLFSGFEDVPIGLAKTNDVIDGWTVTNTKVRISQSSRAHSGTYYATLSHDSASKAKEGGAIWRDLPTAVGQDYKLSFVTRASGDDAEYVLGGVLTNLVDVAITLTNSIPASGDWVHQRNPIHCRARSSTPLTIRTESSAMRLDTIELIGPGPHNLAEEALDVLSGERAMGEWVLEVRDHRVGGDNADPDVEPMLISWYIKIMGSEAEDTKAIDSKGRTYTRDDTAEALEDGKKVRGRISENEINYWTVETCEDSTKLNIELFSGEEAQQRQGLFAGQLWRFPIRRQRRRRLCSGRHERLLLR